MTFGGWNKFIAALGQTNLLLCIILMILVNCFNIIQSTFLPLFFISVYGVKTSMLSILPLLKSITTILVYLMITSRIQLHSIRHPLLIGLGSYLCGLSMLLLCIPLGSKAIGVVFISAVFDALAAAILVPLYETMMSVSIPDNIRARANSLITAIILLICIPVGWLSGILSQQNRILPLAVNFSIIIVQIIVVWFITRNSRKK